MVADDGLQQLLRTALQNDEYKIPCRSTIDKISHIICITQR